MKLNKQTSESRNKTIKKTKIMVLGQQLAHAEQACIHIIKPTYTRKIMRTQACSCPETLKTRKQGRTLKQKFQQPNMHFKHTKTQTYTRKAYQNMC